MGNISLLLKKNKNHNSVLSKLKNSFKKIKAPTIFIRIKQKLSLHERQFVILWMESI